MPTADEAFVLESAVMAARAAERGSWLPLAESLYTFHTAQAWRDLGWEKFTEWIATPELSLGRRHAYRLIAIWAWAQDKHIALAELHECDVTKLALVLPHVLLDEVSAEDAIADVKSLSRSDLSAKYVGSELPAATPAEPETEICADCGRTILKEAV